MALGAMGAMGTLGGIFSRAVAEEMRKQVPNFAVVEVTDRNYYLACPPDEVLMGFAQQKKVSENTWRLMTEWFDRYGSDSVDDQLLNAQGAIAPSRSHTSLAGSAPRRHRQRTIPNAMSQNSLENTSAPANARE